MSTDREGDFERSVQHRNFVHMIRLMADRHGDDYVMHAVATALHEYPERDDAQMGLRLVHEAPASDDTDARDEELAG